MSGPGSLRAAGHALLHWQRRQEVNTNNLANAETPGFRGQRVFSEVLQGGLPTIGTAVDPTRGDLRRTGAPLDLALGGDGHFVVQTPTGEKAVRSGSFTLDADGQIVDANGWPLLGDSGALLLPPGPVEIDTRGGVTVAGERVGRLRIVSGSPAAASGRGVAVSGQRPRGEGVGQADAGADLAREEDSLGFMPGLVDGGANVGDAMPEELVEVRQGYLESSNVSALNSLIEMTTIQRSYEAVQSSVRAIDSVMETVSNRLGRVE
jgi:flagellar basal body rod protein FlgG